MRPKNEKRKIAILDIVNQLQAAPQRKPGKLVIYAKFKNEYPDLKFSNRPEWEALFDRLIVDGLIFGDVHDYFALTSEGEKYLQEPKTPYVQIGDIRESNIQIGNSNQMVISNYIKVLTELENRISVDQSIPAAEKASTLEKIKTGINVLDILFKLPNVAKHLDEILRNLPQC